MVPAAKPRAWKTASASLAEALAALDASERFRASFGDGFVDYLLRIKRAEIARYNAEVTAWEQREYFDLF